jgi:uncharacterized membrane protein YphA (DoxX/SURF4 family)
MFSFRSVVRHGSSLLGASWATLPLRLAIGLTFVWAGAGKWLGQVELPASSRPVLVECGAIAADAPPEASTAPSPAAATTLPTSADGPTVMGPAPASPPSAPSSQEPITARRLWGLTLKIHAAGQTPKRPSETFSITPGLNQPIDPAPTPGPFWPSWLSSPRMAAVQAWSVMIVELLAGFLVLIGLLTRPAALVLCGTMLGALWLDQLGPAIGSGQTRWGFLPSYPAFDPKAWMPIFWQLALSCSCLALALLPRGPLSADRLFFGPRRDDDNDEL